MELTSLISRFFSGLDKTSKFDLVCDGSLDFTASKSNLEKIRSGRANEWFTAQFVALKMLEEQGEVTSFPDGFMMPASTAVRLDAELMTLLGLPELWGGVIDADIKGKASNPDFKIDLAVTTQQGRSTLNYSISGPFIRFGKEAEYLLTPSQLMVFEAQNLHQKSEKSEYDNLLFLHALQEAQYQGCRLKLKHFDKLRILTPSSVTVDVELNANGDLILTPNMGQHASHEAIQRVLGQLQSDSSVSLKVGDEIILFSEEKLKAVKEVISNRVVPKSQVKAFLENPTAFIDASLVDLDLGFSLRVRGATTFKHAYFGETDESGIDWFGTSLTTETIYPISKLIDAIDDRPALLEVSKKLDDAQHTGATVFDYEGKSYDIGDREAVSKTLVAIEDKISKPAGGTSEDEPGELEKDSSEKEIHVVDIDLNDEELSENSPQVDKLIADMAWEGELNWDNHKRKPFPHQEVGVRWILGVEQKILTEPSISGALLADDMGLGKTYMALSAIEHMYQRMTIDAKTKKPTLIVAPLSLLENWKDEVDKTFEASPFKDIVILQSAADLNRYKMGGVEIRNQKNSDEELEPKYSLKVGKNFGSERLDQPQRLVITTYQTLRDYQFSLCLIDWGVVVFDEAQNTKNPNALQTRAAKGLKADFKLVATGTPVENSLADFWCLMDTASPGYLGTYQEFRSHYISPILKSAGDEVEEVRARLGRELRIAVGALMLRRVKEDNLKGLPAKNMYAGGHFDGWGYLKELESTMVGYQRDVYEGTISNQIENEDSHALTTLMRLRDSSLHPRLSDGGRLELPRSSKVARELYLESGKLSSLLETLDRIKSRQEKCIIFAVNKRLQSFLSITLGQIYGLGPLSVINGDAKAVAKRKSVPTRKSMITDFEAKEGFNLIVMSPVAAGVGLTVVGANHVVHLERHWNPAKEAQATDRVYRIGQTKDVHIYIPLLHHPEFESFDVNLHRLLTQKTLLKDAVVTPEDVVPQPSGVGGSITEDLINKRITPDELDKLSWQQFEALCLTLLSKHYDSESAWLTNAGADHGADGVILTQSGNILMQAKYTQRRYDGYKGIQEIHSAKPIYESEMQKTFGRLVFITNSPSLAKRTDDIAKTCGVEVIDRAKLLTYLDENEVTYKDVLTRLEKRRLKV
ncbi:SNF2-related protein [Vibrio crassostreae]|uniref:Helicase n=3 Tax=Vibrio TaxID=662 RepID=A0ABM9QPQ5_9VIBR|nr:SNF2-related protein [Vibrio crassostreae]TCL30462.1 SNF2 family DNA or RNA helicase [Vibrio crassostreae]TCT53451.1 SNF2 family DNA or RNA helicase [Vibrio crassostreae]TCT57738.1 SNF2 family DNA or RNA helicase [Vibrio crassostreae]CAK1859309.1 restriction system protein [Vibrio crassostreae]CAK1860091.1 restriction system protein [Vibrio crassostreae]